MKKTKSINLVKPIFEKVLRAYTGDNRSYYHKMLNTLLGSGLFEVRLCPDSKVWTNSKVLKKHNIIVKMPKANQAWVSYTRGGIDALDIMRGIGAILQTDAAKAIIPAYVDLDNRCHRCAHQSVPGYIRIFSHVCNGICFECYGTGYNPRFKAIVEIENPETNGKV